MENLNADALSFSLCRTCSANDNEEQITIIPVIKLIGSVVYEGVMLW